MSLSYGYSGCPTVIDYHAVDGEQGEFRLLQDAMSHLKASCIRGSRGSCHSDRYCSYQTAEPPYLVLNRLEDHGYKVVAATSVADKTRCGTDYVSQMWTLHKQR